MSPAVRINVLLIVGNHLLCKALGRILEKRADLCVVAKCTDLANPAQTIARLVSDVILLDSVAATVLLRSSGVRVRELNPSAQVLMIGMECDECAFLDAVRAGVRGYLLNEASAGEVIAAVRSLANGEAVCPPQLRKTLFDTVAGLTGFTRNVEKMTNRLTRREQELLPLIARGLTNKEIASQLNISEQTVKNHIHRLLRKIGATDRFQLCELSYA